MLTVVRSQPRTVSHPVPVAVVAASESASVEVAIVERQASVWASIEIGEDTVVAAADDQQPLLFERTGGHRVGRKQVIERPDGDPDRCCL